MTDSVTDLLGTFAGLALRPLAISHFAIFIVQSSHHAPIHRNALLSLPFAGFEPKELIGRPSLELVHPDEFPRVRQLH